MATVNVQALTPVVTPSFGDFNPYFSVVGTIAPFPQSATLAAGPNIFTVPTSAQGVIVTPPTTNTAALRTKGCPGINGTVTLTVGSTIVTGVAIGTAGTGYPASSAFIATPTQSGGSGCSFVVVVASTGIPSSMVFLTGQGGTGYVAATVPYTCADIGFNRPPGLPWIEQFDVLNLPASYVIWAASAVTGATILYWF